MKCSRCEKEAHKGKVEGGQFVCTACLRKEKIEQGKLITFYALLVGYRRAEPRMVKAVYKDGKTYYTRVEADVGYPFDARVHKTSYGRRDPGWRTEQEAVDAKLRNVRDDYLSKVKSAEEAKQKLEELELWCIQQGFKITQPAKSKEEDLV